MTDERMNLLMNCAPERSIILLEDIDAATTQTRQQHSKYEGLNLLTLSGLLNSLDGVASSEGRLVFMTTNYVERLDEALTRPGRVDFQQYIGHASDFQLAQMFNRFYSTSDLQKDEFIRRVRNTSSHISPAELQALFMEFKDNSGDLIRQLSTNTNK
ncbi:hypothetical protein ACOME3_007202 [Neoechinorhynchus agilis]